MKLARKHRCAALLACLLLGFPSLAPAAEDLGVLLARARAARDEGRFAAALEAYGAMLEIVATHQTALLERAETLAWAGETDAALAGYAQFRAAYPDLAVEADLRAARAAAWSGRYAVARDLLRSWVLRGDAQAVVDDATYLAWAGDLEESAAVLDSWLAAHPDDRSARLQRAVVASWAGDLPAATRHYEAVRAARPGDPQATVGLAQVSLWSQNPEAARRLLDGLEPADQGRPESELLAARVDAAMNRPRTARARLAALAAGSRETRTDALDALGELVDIQGPWLETTWARTTTNEGLSVADPALRVRAPLGQGTVELGATAHGARFGAAEERTTNWGLRASHPLGARIRVSGSVVRSSAIGGTEAWGGGAGVAARIRPGLDLHAGWDRSFADFTPDAMRRRIAIDTLDAGATLAVAAGRGVISAGVSRAALDAGSRRQGAHFAYEHRFTPAVFQLRTGANVRWFGYSETLPLGFFNPERFRYAGLNGTLAYRRAHRWDASVDLRAGWQEIDRQPRQFAWGYGANVGWSAPRRVVSVYLAWAASVAGLPVAGEGDPRGYRDRTLRLAVRVRPHL